MLVKNVTSAAAQEPASTKVSLRCPSCRQQGTFDPFPGVHDLLNHQGGAVLGQRRCPSPSCYAHVFFIQDGANLVVSYPPETIDFDTTNLPAGVVEAMEEAVKCHSSQCFKASAIMVRKTLEMLCGDQQATGSNLKERIKDLGTKVVLPQALLDGLDGLRLLGNDAAHIESQVYDDVGKDEVEVGIEVAKEVLKAVYQYSALIDKLDALKRSRNP